jgi:hypothetical protein
MGGGLMQLVAYGAQDIYLTGNPQITFFKVVYRRHTNFAMECIKQSFSGSSTFKPNTNTFPQATISRTGDLLSKLYVVSNKAGITNGTAIIDLAEIEIGGQSIDKQTSEWMNIWKELSTDESKAIGLKTMQGDIGITDSTGVKTVQIPLQFWFCRNVGLALPLIALQYHEVVVKLTTGTGHGAQTEGNLELWGDYIYLDTDERRRFAQVSHEYLIEQVQQNQGSGNSNMLTFNHPVKELIWTNNKTESYDSANLVLNGQERFALQDKEYFQLRQPYDYHTAIPRQNLPSGVKISTLDRQALIETPTNYQSSYDISGFSGDSPDVSGTIHLNGEALTIGIKEDVINNAFDASGIKKGDQLAFIISDASGVDLEIVNNTGGDASGGDIFFFNALTSPTVESNKLTFKISVPTESKNKPSTITSMFRKTVGDYTTAGTKVQLVKITSPDFDARTSKMNKQINVYSFALQPEEHQPSGTCNFSRIDNAMLNTVGVHNLANENIYAVNYNVLRIMSGMGGLAYSN